MDTASAIIMLLEIWGVLGGLVALAFLGFGIDRIDADAKDAYIFRPLLIPGVLLIWPLVLWRWWQIEAETTPWMKRYQPVRKSHGLVILAMSLAIVVAISLGISARQIWPADFAPQQLSEADQ